MRSLWLIQNWKNSENYRNIKRFYEQRSLLDILGSSRSEESHSNFLAWLLDPDESHGLGALPIRRFLEMLSYAVHQVPVNRAQLDCRWTIDKNDNNTLGTLTHDILLGRFTVDVESLVREYAIDPDSAGNRRRLDLLLSGAIKGTSDHRNIRLIIENKVKSKENNDQTIDYAKWANNRTEDDKRCNILVYLWPCSQRKLMSLTRNPCASDEFIQINYQMLLDHVILPCKNMLHDPHVKSTFDSYIMSLTRPVLSLGGGTEELIMAYTDDEKKLLKDFFSEHRSLFEAIVDAISEGEILSGQEEQPEEIIAKAKAFREVLAKTNALPNKLTWLITNGYVKLGDTLTLVDAGPGENKDALSSIPLDDKRRRAKILEPSGRSMVAWLADDRQRFSLSALYSHILMSVGSSGKGGAWSSSYFRFDKNGKTVKEYFEEVYKPAQ